MRLPLAVDEGMVDRDGAELILDDRDAQPVFVRREHAVDQRRFPTAEESRHDRDWHVACRSGRLGAAVRAIAASRYGLAQLERLALDSLKAAALQEVHEDLRENKGADDHGGDHPGIERQHTLAHQFRSLAYERAGAPRPRSAAATALSPSPAPAPAHAGDITG